MADIPALTQLIEPEVRALGLELVRVSMFGGEDGPVLQVMAERPETGQLTLDECGTLSRALSDVFDREDPIADAYRLEVSSPGIDRPLTRPKDYVNWAGHKARLKLREPLGSRKQFDGELLGLEGEEALAQVGPDRLRIPLTQIATAKLVLTDKLIAATAPLDRSGAEEEFEEEDD